MINDLQKENKTEILSVIYEGEVSGLVITLLYKDMVLVDYLAIAPDKRKLGIGSKIVDEIRRRYKNRRIILEIETIDDTAENNEQRIRRKKFYIKNGLKSNEMLVRLNGIEMETMVFSEKIDYEEYYSIYENTFSERICSLVSKI